MEVVAIQGPSMCGKTPTIQLVFEGLKKRGYVPDEYREISNGDFIAVMVNGTDKLGLAWQGDYPDLLAQYLKHLQNAGCRRTACTARTKGRTTIEIKKYPAFFIKKTKAKGIDTELIANIKDAEAIINYLMQS